MDTLTFKDLSRVQSIDALRKLRDYYWGDGRQISSRTLNAVYDLVGGRVALLNRMAHRRDMLKAADQLVEDEKEWLLSKTGIIVDHDDDVSAAGACWSCKVTESPEPADVDLQTGDGRAKWVGLGRCCGTARRIFILMSLLTEWSTTSWLLFTELAQRQAELERLPVPEDDPHSERVKLPLDATDPSQDIEKDVQGDDCPNPHITWGEARQVMTRPESVGAFGAVANASHTHRAVLTKVAPS